MGKHKVLIVDDVEAMRLLLRSVVESMGLAAVEASSGKEAISVLAKEGASISLVLLDIELPDMKAYDILERYKKDPSLIRPKICLVSGHRDKEAVTQGLALGANDFIVKPIDPAMVAERIARLLGIQAANPLLNGRVAANLSATVQSLPDKVELKITELSPSIWIATSPTEIKPNSVIDLAVPGLKFHLAVEHTFNVRVAKCRPQDGRYIIELKLFRLPDKIASILRNLVYRGRRVA